MKLYWPAALLAAASGVAAAAVSDRSVDSHYLPEGHPIIGSGGNHHYHTDLVAGGDDTGVEDAAVAAALPPPPRRIPTSYESAVLARRILNRTPFGTISTVFPASDPGLENSWEARPAGLAGVPVGLPEYVAACEGGPDGGASRESAAAAGNPTLLAIHIATTFKNAKAGSNVSLALQWVPPPPPPAPRRSFWRGHWQALVGRSAQEETVPPAAKAAAVASYAALPRFSLIGYLEPIPGQDAPVSDVARCFVRTHPDAKWWLPGNPVHQSGWVRLVVTHVYWVGGFGDRAYIGWIPVEEWRNVTRTEWEQVRLPGEHHGAAASWMDGSEL